MKKLLFTVAIFVTYVTYSKPAQLKQKATTAAKPEKPSWLARQKQSLFGKAEGGKRFAWTQKGAESAAEGKAPAVFQQKKIERQTRREKEKEELEQWRSDEKYAKEQRQLEERLAKEERERRKHETPQDKLNPERGGKGQMVTPKGNTILGTGGGAYVIVNPEGKEIGRIGARSKAVYEKDILGPISRGEL